MSKIIQIENFSKMKGPFVICNQENFISTVLFNRNLNVLLVGDLNGNVIQFKWRNKAWVKQKDYGNLKIGRIYSCDHYQNIAVFGGNLSSLRFIHMEKMQILGDSLQTAVEVIYSIQFCQITSKIYLILGGRWVSYSRDNTDIFQVSKEFMERGSIKSQFYPGRKLFEYKF